MRWEKKPSRPVFRDDQWHRGFAYIPRLIGNTWVWFEPVEQRLHYGDIDEPFTNWWEYRLPEGDVR